MLSTPKAFCALCNPSLAQKPSRSKYGLPPHNTQIAIRGGKVANVAKNEYEKATGQKAIINFLYLPYEKDFIPRY